MIDLINSTLKGKHAFIALLRVLSYDRKDSYLAHS